MGGPCGKDLSDVADTVAARRHITDVDGHPRAGPRAPSHAQTVRTPPWGAFLPGWVAAPAPGGPMCRLWRSIGTRDHGCQFSEAIVRGWRTRVAARLAPPVKRMADLIAGGDLQQREETDIRLSGMLPWLHVPGTRFLAWLVGRYRTDGRALMPLTMLRAGVVPTWCASMQEAPGRSISRGRQRGEVSCWICMKPVSRGVYSTSPVFPPSNGTHGEPALVRSWLLALRFIFPPCPLLKKARADTSAARAGICSMLCSCEPIRCWLCSMTGGFLCPFIWPYEIFAWPTCSTRSLASFAMLLSFSHAVLSCGCFLWSSKNEVRWP